MTGSLAIATIAGFLSYKSMQDEQNKHTHNLGLKLRRRRPLWQDGLLFLGLSLTLWGGAHMALNAGAFSQIFAFKYENLKTTVFAAEEETVATEEMEEVVQDTPLAEVDVQKMAVQKEKLPRKNKAKALFSAMEVYPADDRIYIPSIDKNIPLVSVPNHQNWQQLEHNIQDGLQDGVVVHPVSHEPGSFGNFFVTGHSSYYSWDPGRFKDVFALLHEVEIGDTVEVFWHGQKYVYEIGERNVVDPTEISVLNQPTNKAIITLMTCTPVGTNKQRLILTGELMEGDL